MCRFSIQWLIDAHSVDMSSLDDNSIDIALALAKLHECLTNCSTTDVSALLIAHGMDVDDPSLDRSDVLSHLMNGYCANHAAPACIEISRGVRSPVEMAITVSKTVIDRYSRKQISLENLTAICSAVGMHSGGRRPESLSLVKKLKQRCKELHPLLNCTGVGSTFNTVESLGKRSLQQLAIQHQVHSECDDVDDVRARLVDHLSSGSCQASGSGLCPSFRDEYKNTADNDLETHILQFAAKKGSVSKKALKQILKCRNIEFGENDGIRCLRKVLRLHVTQLRRGKQPELSQNYRSELRSAHDKKLEEIRSSWPEPASMQRKEECIRNFRATTSSESLREFTCACCAEGVNCSERKIISINDIDVNLMRDRTDRVFDTSECMPPGLPFTEGPLANIQVDSSGVIQTEEGLSLQLCHRCSSALL